MRKVITQYVDREEKREAWEEYRTTGLRVTADEAKLAVKAIRQGVKVLGQQPGVGRPIEDMPDEFRDSGYVARCRRIDSDAVTILAVRHQKEVGY
ncbi:type II toxin-antitoxin system RelE/ParE family toxin [Castellaniella sp.]|uniref:type II toxin-antitoxin system RelE/ParE family toxin n=1 Tax=Castellaniella sp. TaxID=1955812 RepID=UPI002AFEB9CB|nr:type II toxin-antitoxin system RelE/ParE family toxin [Castellaniella sp.]